MLSQRPAKIVVNQRTLHQGIVERALLAQAFEHFRRQCAQVHWPGLDRRAREAPELQQVPRQFVHVRRVRLDAPQVVLVLLVAAGGESGGMECIDLGPGCRAERSGRHAAAMAGRTCRALT